METFYIQQRMSLRQMCVRSATTMTFLVTTFFSNGLNKRQNFIRLSHMQSAWLNSVKLLSKVNNKWNEIALLFTQSELGNPNSGTASPHSVSSSFGFVPRTSVFRRNFLTVTANRRNDWSGGTLGTQCEMHSAACTQSVTYPNAGTFLGSVWLLSGLGLVVF